MNGGLRGKAKWLVVIGGCGLDPGRMAPPSRGGLFRAPVRRRAIRPSERQFERARGAGQFADRGPASLRMGRRSEKAKEVELPPVKDPAAESRRRRTNKVADEGAPEGDASAGVDGAQPSAASAEGKPAEGRRGKKDKAAKAAAESAPPAELASEISPESGAQTDLTAEGADKDIEEVAAAPIGDKEHWDLCLIVDAVTTVEEDAEKVLNPTC